MSDKTDRVAAAARKTQAEYLEGLQREAQAYKESGRKDRHAEVQVEIKRVEATLSPGGTSGTTTRRGSGKDDKAGKDARSGVDVGEQPDGDAGAGEKTGD